MEWITANWDSVLLALTALATVALTVTKMTKTEKDDKYANQFKKIVDILSMKTKKK